ncbi:MAG: trypsin-like peptidase domain-containing protein [Pseudomonadota bacterium]
MSSSNLRSAFLFISRCVVAGLAIACVVFLFRQAFPSSLGSTRQPPASYADAVAASANAVVNVYTTRLVTGVDDSGLLRTTQQVNLGSGVIIDADGFIVTNYHVIQNAGEIRVQLADGRIATPTLVGEDSDTDLALLKVDLPDLEAIQLGRSDQVRIGDVVLAIGNPYGLSQTVTQGIISATGRGSLRLTTFENYIQTDAAINSGNSGGALINTQGELIGINTAVVSREENIQGISFAIPANLVSGVVQALRRDGRVPRGWLGLTMGALTDEGWQQVGLPPDIGVMLIEVVPNGPAWNAGVRRGDVLVSVNGKRVQTGQQALLTVASFQPGENLSLDLIRNGAPWQTVAVAGDRADAESPP